MSRIIDILDYSWFSDRHTLARTEPTLGPLVIRSDIFAPPPVGGWSRPIVMSVFFCLSASIPQKQHVQTSPKPRCLWPWLIPSLSVLRYVVDFRLRGWRRVCRDNRPGKDDASMGRFIRGVAALDHGCPIQIAKPWLDRDWSL